MATMTLELLRRIDEQAWSQAHRRLCSRLSTPVAKVFGRQVQTILRGQDTFIEKRLTPCHQYLSCLIKNFRGDPADSDVEFEPDPDASIKTMTEDEAVKKIMQEIDDNSVNDGGFYRAIQKLEGVEAAGQGLHQLNTSCD